MTLLLLAAAILLLPGPARDGWASRHEVPVGSGANRRSLPSLRVAACLVGALLCVVVGGRAGVLLAIPVGYATWYLSALFTPKNRIHLDPSAVALLLDLLASALSAGAPPESAIDSVTSAVRVHGTDALREAAAPMALVGRLLALGTDPVQAWSMLESEPVLTQVAMAGRRCANSGSRLAGAFADAATQLRAENRQRELTQAQRIGVWALLPLGCCFLPAFVCLGVAPVVIGIAGQVVLG